MRRCLHTAAKGHSGCVQYVTVAQAASRVGVTPGTIRKRCAAGELTCRRVGGRWEVEESQLPVVAATTSGLRALRGADFTRALEQIEALDLTEEWIPDILRHKDQLADRTQVLLNAKQRLVRGEVGRSTEVQVPKTPFFTRAGQLIPLEDRIVLHSVVSLFSHDIEAQLSPEVFSARLAVRGKYLTRRGTHQWARWVKHVRSSLQGPTRWMIKTDLTAYFDTIQHDILDGDLQALGVSGEVRAALMMLLRAWSPLHGNGLLQGPDACRLLGNLYLVPVDHAVLGAGFRYSRYMDDIRIVGDSKVEVIAAFRLLEQEVRKRGLILSPSKTSLLSGKDARNVDRDDWKTRALYFMDRRSHRLATFYLRRIFDRATLSGDTVDVRSSKFSLWRLAQLGDRSVLRSVLSNLDNLAPVASVVAEYLRPYAGRKRVRTGLTDYLESDASIRHEYSMYYLFALMLERRKSLPATWVEAANESLRNPQAPVWLRGVAANVVTRGGDLGDIVWIRGQIRSASGEDYVRMLLVALARVGALDAASAAHARGRSSYLIRTVDYLERVRYLPSLTKVHGYVKI